jgi:outer membrane protein
VKRILCLASVIAAFCFAAQGQTAKLAFVNSETILRELPEAVDAQKELERTVKGWQDELEKMGKDLQDAVADYQQKQSLLDPATKAGKEKAIQDMQQKAREFQFQKFDTREGEAAKLRDKKFAPIQDKVMETIKTIAKEESVSFVFDKTSLSGNLLFADAKYELTFKVIDRLKRGGATKSDKK